jgi:hypothetical protein
MSRNAKGPPSRGDDGSYAPREDYGRQVVPLVGAAVPLTLTWLAMQTDGPAAEAGAGATKPATAASMAARTRERLSKTSSE